jgi:nucleotide-binding universal stress UspA family protein
MKKARRILVGLKEKDHAVELTDLACRIGARGASLVLVHVIELPAATPLDAAVPDLEARGRKILAAAARVARRSRMKVATELLRARSAGQALVEECREKKIELAVVGFHRPKTLEELLFGTTHKFLARNAPCHMLMSIPAGSRKPR